MFNTGRPHPVYRLSDLRDGDNPLKEIQNLTNSSTTTETDSTSRSILPKLSSTISSFPSVTTPANENRVSSMEIRPVTAFFKVLDKMSFNIPHFVNSDTSKLSTNDSDEDKMKNLFPIQNGVLASTLESKVTRVLKAEQKSMAAREDLIKDFRNWTLLIPNTESSSMVKDFTELLSRQKTGDQATLTKLSQLKNHLLSVHAREKKQRELINEQTKILKQIKDSEVKYGHNATVTALLREKLEANIYNLEVVELQLVRSISESLREAFLDYITALHTTSIKNYNACSQFYGKLINCEFPVNEKSNSREPGSGVKVYNNRRERPLSAPSSSSNFMTAEVKNILKKNSANDNQAQPIKLIDNDKVSYTPNKEYLGRHKLAPTKNQSAQPQQTSRDEIGEFENELFNQGFFKEPGVLHSGEWN